MREEHISNDAEADDCNSVGKVYLSRFLRKFVHPTTKPDRRATPRPRLPPLAAYLISPLCLARYAKATKRNGGDSPLETSRRSFPGEEVSSQHFSLARVSRHRTFAKLGS